MRIGHRVRKVLLGQVSALGAAVLTIVSLTPQSGVSAATLKTLYDGNHPGAVIMDATGHLYGTAGDTVFELTPDATMTTWTERVLYTFCVEGVDRCTDGYSPGGLIMGAAGRLYGTTYLGGVHGAYGVESIGTVFELTPNAA